MPAAGPSRSAKANGWWTIYDAVEDLLEPDDLRRCPRRLPRRPHRLGRVPAVGSQADALVGRQRRQAGDTRQPHREDRLRGRVRPPRPGLTDVDGGWARGTDPARRAVRRALPAPAGRPPSPCDGRSSERGRPGGGHQRLVRGRCGRGARRPRPRRTKGWWSFRWVGRRTSGTSSLTSDQPAPTLDSPGCAISARRSSSVARWNGPVSPRAPTGRPWRPPASSSASATSRTS